MTSVGIEPTTSGLDLPLLCRLSYEVGQRKSGTIKVVTIKWVFMGLHSTLTYTSELILYLKPVWSFSPSVCDIAIDWLAFCRDWNIWNLLEAIDADFCQVYFSHLTIKTCASREEPPQTLGGVMGATYHKSASFLV